MGFTVNSEINDSGEEPTAADSSPYRISSDPVVSVSASNDERTGATLLPRSYGSQSLYLIARDPCTLYAYWDIDWTTVFDEPTPRERKIHLRILNTDGSQETSLEVEPMNGSCLIELSTDAGRYRGELGYERLGEWKSICTSAVAVAPPAGVKDDAEADFATIPFHLSYQQMLDVLRTPPQESGSLTKMLAALRERAHSESACNFQPGERELVVTIDELVATDPPPAAAPATALWTPERVERMLGVNSSSSLGGGGGSRGS